MTGGMTKCEIGTGESRIVVRVFMCHRDETDLSCDETDAKNAVLEGFLKPEYAGKVGNTLDPYKVDVIEYREWPGSARSFPLNPPSSRAGISPRAFAPRFRRL